MKSLALLFLLYFSSKLYALEKEIEKLYIANNITGSILIESADGKQKYQYNLNDKERFIPASTFKIPNTLIILEEGLIKDPTEIIAWDGIDREYAPWNKDQTLETAFKNSCVWCYQRYARRVGDARYRAYLHKFRYGNQLTGPDVTRFWLDGDLKLSVQDQIDFLRKLHSGNLPIQKQHLSTLKRIMLSENQTQLKIWSKSGWSGEDGWYVGYLLVDNKTWFFANHIKIHQTQDLPLRKQLTMDVLKLAKIIQ